MSVNLDDLLDGLKSGIAYFPNTVKLVFISLFIAIIIGGIIAFVRFYNVPVLSQIFTAFVTLYQGVPTVVALLIYNLLFMSCMNDVFAFFHSSKTIADVDTIWIGIFALSLNAICSVTETIRGALEAVDFAQNEAGYSVGLTKVQTIRRIILPQIVPVAIPPLTNNVIGLIKNSSIVSVVGIIEVTQGSLIPSMVDYSFFEGYLAAAIIYWAFSVLVEFAAAQAEKHSGKFRRTI